MSKTDVLPLMREAMASLAVHYNPAMEQARAAAGIQPAEFRVVNWLAHTDPEPATGASIAQMFPYVSPAQIEERLAAVAAGQKFVERTPERAYRLTPSGRQIFKQALAAAWDRLAGFEPIAAADMRRLAELLKRLVDASVAAPEPRDKRHLAFSRRVDPGAGMHPGVLIDQYLTDLVLFRDDVHPAAWQRYNVNGPTWEVFTLIWNGAANTLDTLTERLTGYGRPIDSLPQALRDLAAREWVVKENGQYALTEEGRRRRQEAEDETDRLFYAPWVALNDTETDELRGLLARLRDGARALAEQNTG
jgi:DNA-binding MarR family transcriptional regulator